MKKQIAIMFALVAIAVIGYWLISGAHVFTMTQVQVPVEDPLFGTTTMEWKKEFHPGLEYVGPISAVLLLGALIFFRLARRERRHHIA